MKEDYRIKIRFYNPICNFKLCICKADEQHHCKPIPTDDWNEWKKQAKARANYCGYVGLELTAHEVVTKQLPEKKARTCDYLIKDF